MVLMMSQVKTTDQGGDRSGAGSDLEDGGQEDGQRGQHLHH